MRTSLFLIHAIIAKPPLPLIAELAAPVALISKGRAATAEGAALQAIERVGGQAAAGARTAAAADVAWF